MKHAHLCLGGESILSRLFANWILERGIPVDIPQTYTSKVHKTEIDTSALLQFITDNHRVADHKTRQYFILHQRAITEIAEGNEL